MSLIAVWDSSSPNLVVGHVKSAWKGFQDFALRDNVLEIAVGLIIGSAFAAVVTSLVTDILLPPVSLLPFFNRNIEEKFLILRAGPHYAHGYNTLQQAFDDGAVALAYGLFMTKIINFFAIALALYFIAYVYSNLTHDSIITKTSKCGYCRKAISLTAKRCPFCTSWLDGREDESGPP